MYDIIVRIGVRFRAMDKTSIGCFLDPMEGGNLTEGGVVVRVKKNFLN